MLRRLPRGRRERPRGARAGARARAGGRVHGAQGCAAGTADALARELEGMLSRFLSLKAAAAAGEPCGELVDRPTLETCVCVAATALACVMAGTGDVETFRVSGGCARVDSAATTTTASAGAAAAAALRAATRAGRAGVSAPLWRAGPRSRRRSGFCSWAGATMTFSTDNASVAALWMATYPRFPQNASDNRCHLQACPHLYGARRAAVGCSPRRRRRRRRRRHRARRDARSGRYRSPRGDRPDAVSAARPERPRLREGGGRPVLARLRETTRAVCATSTRRDASVQRLAGALPYAADPTGARAGAAASLDVVRARARSRRPGVSA